MIDPINRALERLEGHLWNCGLADEPRHTDPLRPILTDLAAEIRRECMDEISRDTANAHDRLDAAEARLAAVREAKDRLRGSILAEELDAILDGKKTEDRNGEG